MGLAFSRIWERMFGKREMRILMVGLDAAGKTCVTCRFVVSATLRRLLFLAQDDPVQAEAGRGGDDDSDDRV